MSKRKSIPLSPDDVILDTNLYVVQKNFKVWKKKDVLDIAMASLPEQALKAAQQKLKDLPESKRAEYLAFVCRMEPVLTH